MSDRATRIVELNDELRKKVGLSGAGRDQVLMTQGIHTLEDEQKEAILAQVRAFDAFTEENDPYGERDFGAIDVPGLVEMVFWKIDYYDPTLQKGSEDPADEEATTRVLTIMLASEY